MGLMDFIFRKKNESFQKLTEKRYGKYEFPKGVLRLPNIRYDDKVAKRRLDVYRRTDIQSDLPVIVNVHGGGLVMGNKEFNTYFCAQLAQMGFVVFSIEYRLVPDVQIYGQLDDVSRAMDFVYDDAAAFGGDLSNVYMVGDSAGALLTVYALALQKNKRFASTVNIKPSKLKVNAAGLISGMFYTTRFDEIGIFMSKSLWGKGWKRRAIARFTNPGHDSIVGNLPPCYLITSGKDNLRSYTQDFMDALWRAGNRFGKFDCDPEGKDGRLTHAFPVFEPDYAESREAMKLMVDFFNQNRNEGGKSE